MKEDKRLINLDNFEDGQYGEDDSMYTDEDNAFLEEAMLKAMNGEYMPEDDDETEFYRIGSQGGGIDPELVKQAVYSQIDFVLPEHIWDEIDTAFGECWNNEIGIGGWIHENQIETYIYDHLKKMKILFEYEKIEVITEIIFKHFNDIGAYMDE